MTRCLSLTVLLLTSCAAPNLRRVASPVTTARAEAVRDRYWTEQRAQRPSPAPDCEWLPLRRPEHTQDGVILTDSIEYLRIPRSP